MYTYGDKKSQERHLSTCIHSLRKTVGENVVTLTLRSDSDFERSNASLKENKPDCVNPNSNDIDHCVRKNEGIILWFSADYSIANEFEKSSWCTHKNNQVIPGILQASV